MRVLILTLNFPPDGVSTAHLMGELALSLHQAGHNVSVITTTPHQAVDVDASSTQPIVRRSFSAVGRSRLQGIPVSHVLMPAKADKPVLRILQWTWFHAASTILGWVSPRPEVILATSPPLTNGLIAWIIGRFGRVPFIYNVQELYPEVAIQLGYLRNAAAIGLLRRIERLVYRLSGAVSAISPEMAAAVKATRSTPHTKVHVIPNFVDTETFRPLEKSNEFSRGLGLEAKYVVSYAGNAGPAQRVGALLDAAQSLIDRVDIHFLIVGDGSDWPRIRDRVRNEGLHNVTVLPYQPYGLAPLIYASSDLCAVPVHSALSAEALPSKTYKIMASARPVLALTTPRSTLGRLVANVRCGVIVDPGDVAQLVTTIQEFAAEPSQGLALGENGRKYVATHYSREVIVDKYLSMLEHTTAEAAAH